MTKMKTSNPKGIIPFGLGIASASMSYLLTTQLTYCLTDSYGMSAMIVGGILLISRIFDGITDIIAGLIIDKTHSKLGKARPYDLFAIPLWILLIFCFNVPNFNTIGKVLWVFLTYNLCQSVCYTFVTVSQTVRVKHSFSETIRAKALSVASVIASLFSMATAVLCPILISRFESEPFGWTIIILCFAIPGILMTLCMFFMLPELDNEDEEHKEPISIKESFKAIFQNPYLGLITIAIIVISATNVLVATSGNYYFKYVFGDLSALSIVNMISIAGFLLILLMPTLIRKVGNRNTMLIGFSMIALFSILKYLVPSSVFWLAICATLSSVGISLTTSMRDLLLIDCMKYAELKTHKKYEGIYSAVKGFADKIALGLGSVISGAIIQYGGYDAALEIQTAAAQKAISFAYAGMPCILGVIGIIVMYCYRLEKKFKEMEAQVDG